jgi:translation initiation factor IF-3
MTVLEAIEIAQGRGLDLVEVAPTEKPPVCRLMDFGKFKYRKNKKAHEAKKNQKTVKLKEIKTTPRTSEHDYQFKLKHILRFIEDGSKVKVTVFFRGRQITHKELGLVMLDRFVKDTAECSVVTQEAKMEGRMMNIMLEPKKNPGGSTKQKKVETAKPATAVETKKDAADDAIKGETESAKT